MCSVISLNGGDKLVVARTMDFNILETGAQGVIIPAGRKIMSYGKILQFKYETAAMSNHVGPVFAAIQEAVNAGGLYFSLLYNIDNTMGDKKTGTDQILHWCMETMATCGSVAEVRARLANVGSFFGPEGMQATCHLFYNDKDDAIVVEFHAGVPTIYPCPFGVMTNGPEYTWHMTNLRNYLNVSPEGVEKAKDWPNVTQADGKTPYYDYGKIGHGNGFLGVPGGNGSPDRFIRLALNKVYAKDITADNVVAKAANLVGLAHTLYGTQTSAGAAKVTGQDETLWTALKWIEDGKPQLWKRGIKHFNFEQVTDRVLVDA